MTVALKIDSNITGLRYCKEQSIKVLPTTQVWLPLEPNTYPDFGGQITTVARNPINASRQRKKGVTTDLAAAAGTTQDITQTNMPDLLQGVFFAALRRKAEYGVLTGTVTAVATADDSYSAASGLGVFLAGDLVFAAGFTNSANNGLHVVATTSGTKITVSENLVDETPPAGANLVCVGCVLGASDANIVAPGGGVLPRLTATTKNLTQLGLIPGETVFIGGDAAGKKFVNSVNNGFCRVRSVAAGYIEFDKTTGTMVSETGTALTIQIFVGRALKNESTPSLIVRSSYQLERTLGAPDTALPAQIQSEVVIGCIANEWKTNVPQASKATFDLTFIGCDVELRTGATGPKSTPGGSVTAPALVESDAFNTSSDISRMKLAAITTGDANPSALFSYLEDLTITVNNNVTPNKAVAVLGAFEMTAGEFQVGGNATAYFSDIAAVSAVRNNVDATFDMQMVKSNKGIAYDMPLISVGDARPKVEQNAAIKIPLVLEAATGSKISTTLDHTLFMVFFDYLPNAADL